MKESQLENKTAIATNDYVRMVDENNNSVKIKKDSFMAAIRDALPSIISDGETGGGSVLSIINGALKSRTDANLASVLGEFFIDTTYVYITAGQWTNVPNITTDKDGLWCLWLTSEEANKIYFITSSNKITVLNQSWYSVEMQFEDDTLQVKYRSSIGINFGKIN